MNITKRDLKQALGFTYDTEIAEWFEISKVAVGKWGDNEPIPELRMFQARDRRPDLFHKNETS